MIKSHEVYSIPNVSQAWEISEVFNYANNHEISI